MSVAFFYAQFACSPAVNMAVDEYLLSLAVANPGVVYLRLYSWQPGGLTFGFNQRQESALDWLRVGETQVIRRVTGGRAIFHDPSELTYSIAVNSRGQMSPSLVGSLSAVSANLAEALGRFTAAVGIPAVYARKSAPENAQPAFFHKAPCFASSAKYELLADGRKVVASAQKRLGDALLQHGSIKLAGLCRHPALDADVDKIDDHLEPMTESRFGQYALLFRQGMEEALGVEFAPGEADLLQYPGVKAQVARVEMAACERREIIKQSDVASSL